ncbi:unnamed protein product [Amoebophrya sp. A25]|nr:unnamed protein product [Amoebophrya sp. A25]|eukprot:GSA25T00014572001.1
MLQHLQNSLFGLAGGGSNQHGNIQSQDETGSESRGRSPTPRVRSSRDSSVFSEQSSKRAKTSDDEAPSSGVEDLLLASSQLVDLRRAGGPPIMIQASPMEKLSLSPEKKGDLNFSPPARMFYDEEDAGPRSQFTPPGRNRSSVSGRLVSFRSSAPGGAVTASGRTTSTGVTTGTSANLLFAGSGASPSNGGARSSAIGSGMFSRSSGLSPGNSRTPLFHSPASQSPTLGSRRLSAPAHTSSTYNLDRGEKLRASPEQSPTSRRSLIIDTSDPTKRKPVVNSTKTPDFLQNENNATATSPTTKRQTLSCLNQVTTDPRTGNKIRWEEGGVCPLSRQYAKEIAERADEAPKEPLVEYYSENLDVNPKPFTDKNGQKILPPSYKIKILTVEIVPSSILEDNCTPSPKVGGRTKSTSPTRTPTAFQGVIESEFGKDKTKKFFLKMKPPKYAGNSSTSFHAGNESSMASWWQRKLRGDIPDSELQCPEIPVLGSNPLGSLSALGQSGTLNLSQLQNNNPLGIPKQKLRALCQKIGDPKRTHIGISTLFRGMIVPNALETYQQAGTFGNSRDPRAISEQANMTSPLHGIPKIKIPVCCKKKFCHDREHHLRQQMANLQSVLQLVYDFTGYAFDFMIDNTLAFCACSTTREKEEGVSYPMVMINLQRIPNKFAVLAHIVGHEYGHIMRGHLQQQCRCQFGPSSWQHKMLEYEADQFSALFIATMNIDPRDIYTHLANDEVRLQQLKHFVNTFSSFADCDQEP